jgi:hypothetical protein
VPASLSQCLTAANRRVRGRGGFASGPISRAVSLLPVRPRPSGTYVTRRQARKLVRVSFAKVGEYQARGVIHFHAIIRLDGPPNDDENYPYPLVDVDSAWLAELVEQAVGSVEYQAPPVSRAAPGYLLRF